MTMRLILTYSLSKMKRWRMLWKRFTKIITTSINKKFKPSNKHFFKSFRRPLYLDQKIYQMILKLVSYQLLQKLCNHCGINGKGLIWKIVGLVHVMNLLSFSFYGSYYLPLNGFGSFQSSGSSSTLLNWLSIFGQVTHALLTQLVGSGGSGFLRKFLMITNKKK
jgi:hypothetical protein